MLAELPPKRKAGVSSGSWSLLTDGSLFVVSCSLKLASDWTSEPLSMVVIVIARDGLGREFAATKLEPAACAQDCAPAVTEIRSRCKSCRMLTN